GPADPNLKFNYMAVGRWRSSGGNPSMMTNGRNLRDVRGELSAEHKEPPSSYFCQSPFHQAPPPDFQLATTFISLPRSNIVLEDSQ
ncbi:hypothetical protein P7K49_029366, partial [Saguinus oedipus]